MQLCNRYSYLEFYNEFYRDVFFKFKILVFLFTLFLSVKDD